MKPKRGFSNWISKTQGVSIVKKNKYPPEWFGYEHSFRRDRVQALLDGEIDLEHIDRAFDWDETPQGMDFWDCIFDEAADDLDEYRLPQDAVLYLQYLMECRT